ncbi:MAG: hypothetical protein QM702_10860 [Rubrivivax sp.]
MAEIDLSKTVRANLARLQAKPHSTSGARHALTDQGHSSAPSQNTGSGVTASALSTRALQMAAMVDSMSSGIKTVEMAQKGLGSIIRAVGSMQSKLLDARDEQSAAADAGCYRRWPDALGAVERDAGHC